MLAVDMWAAGMILLFFLTCKFPLFQSNDDVEALMEVATIIGRKRMEKAATLHSTLIFSPFDHVIEHSLQAAPSPRTSLLCHMKA